MGIRLLPAVDALETTVLCEWADLFDKMTKLYSLHIVTLCMYFGVTGAATYVVYVVSSHLGNLTSSNFVNS